MTHIVVPDSDTFDRILRRVVWRITEVVNETGWINPEGKQEVRTEIQSRRWTTKETKLIRWRSISVFRQSIKKDRKEFTLILFVRKVGLVG